MKKQGKYIYIPFVVSFIITIVIGVIDYFNGSGILSTKDIFIFFISLIGVIYLIIGMIEIEKQLLTDFLESNFKGRLLIVIITIMFILKAMYEIRLSR